jgi:hypothetical protein
VSKDVKKKILDAVAQARAKGYTLVCDDWGDPFHECACPMAAVILMDDPDKYMASPCENVTTVAKILGVDEKWVDCFIEGFDCNGTADQSQVPEAWKIGNEVSKETKPIAYHLWDGMPTK